MTQKEFTTRTFVEVSASEFEAINTVYLASDLDKDEFCKMWRKMNASRVEKAKAEMREEACRDAAMNICWGIVNNGYTFAEYDKLAEGYFSEKELAALRYFGIRCDKRNKWGFFPDVREVIYRINTEIFA